MPAAVAGCNRWIAVRDGPAPVYLPDRMRARLEEAVGAWMRREAGSRRALIAAAALAVLAGAFLLSQRLQPSDDAYITFRHSRNLAAHLRPAWNLDGTPVLCSTSPAWAFSVGAVSLLAGAERAGVVALSLNAGLLALITLLTFFVLRDLRHDAAASLVGATLVAFNSVNVFVFSLGFEAALFVAVLLAALLLVRNGLDLPAVVLASLAPMVRPEGVLLTPLVWGVVILSGRFRPRLLLAYLALPLAWLAFSLWYYGSPIPHPIRARAMRLSVFRPYDGGPVDLVARLASLPTDLAGFWSGTASSYLFSGARSPKYRDVVAAPLWIALLALPALARGWRQLGARVVYLLVAPLWLMMFAWIGYTEAWYFPPFVTFSIILLYHACLNALDALSSLAGRGRPGPEWVGVAGAVTLSALFATASNYAWNGGRWGFRGPVFARDPRGPLFEDSEIERFRTYRAAARLMNRRLAPSDTVMTSEIGVFGFFSRNDVIDTVGLCTPEALDFYPPPASDIRTPDGQWLSESNNITPTRMVRTLKPDYVLNAVPYIRNLLRDDSPFRKEYKREPGPFGNAWSEPVMLFRRRESDAPPAEPAQSPRP